MDASRRDNARFVYASLNAAQLAAYQDRGYLVYGRTLGDRGLVDFRRGAFAAQRGDELRALLVASLPQQ